MKTATTEIQKAKESPPKTILFLRQVEWTGKGREEEQEEERGRKHVCRREGRRNRVTKRRRRMWAGRRGHWVTAGAELGRWLGTRRCAPRCGIDDTLGYFPLWIGRRRRKEKAGSSSLGSIPSSQPSRRLAPCPSSHPAMFSLPQIYEN